MTHRSRALHVAGPSFGAAILATLLLLFTCNTYAVAPAIIHNAKEAAWRDSVTIVLESNLTMGEEAGDANDVFGQIADIEAYTEIVVMSWIGGFIV